MLLLTSCSKEQIFPQASGRPYEVLVVLDNKTWEAPAGRALFDILDTDVPCLPQSERSFHITQIEPKDFSANFTIFRNIIQVNIDKTQYSRTGMRFMRNKFAMNQIVLTINSPSLEDFQQFCIDHKQEVIDFLTRSEMNRLIKELENCLANLYLPLPCSKGTDQLQERRAVLLDEQQYGNRHGEHRDVQLPV